MAVQIWAFRALLDRDEESITENRWTNFMLMNIADFYQLFSNFSKMECDIKSPLKNEKYLPLQKSECQQHFMVTSNVLFKNSLIISGRLLV